MAFDMTPTRHPIVAAISRVTRPIYSAAGVLALGMLVLITLVTVLQIVFRVFEVQIRGLSDVAAYATAGVTFLGLAPTYRAGGLIRVELLLDRLRPAWRGAAETMCLLAAVAVSGATTFASVGMLITSRELGEAALFLPFPIWWAQVPMVVGLAILTLAFSESLLERLSGNHREALRAEMVADI
jgi:TRAP-type C4-dicarboxylate transport system permease small subunit